MVTIIIFLLVHAALGPVWASSLRPSDSQSACADLVLPQLEASFNILSVTGVEVLNLSIPAVPSQFQPAYNALDFCNVTIVLTHPGDDDYEIVRIWLPLNGGWNGRFQATGGGGLATGYLDMALPPAVALGYATGSSEGGLTLNQTIDPQSGAWVLRKDNTLNWGLLQNYAYRATHDLATVGKALITRFYGIPPYFSYHTGCSQGGRQGYVTAYRYPGDFDGIMANSPAMLEAQALPMFMWPPTVMENIVVPPQCVFDEYLAAIIQACDALDGAIDGLISNPMACHFDVHSLVGSTLNCMGQRVQITPAHAEVVSKVLQGPYTTSGGHIWWGLPTGALFSGLANTTIFNGSLTPAPFSAGAGLIKYFDFHNPNFDITNISYTDFDQAVALSETQFDGTLVPVSFDLSAFRGRGGKLLTWHGMADQYIPYPGSEYFYKKIEHDSGLKDAGIMDFVRLFLAPGATHCLIGGYGPVPMNAFGALVDWVENGTAPEILPASWIRTDQTVISRNLCLWPKMPIYNGSGDVNDADSFSCA